MHSNKVEYSASAGLYCKTHGVKLLFCMTDFSRSKIISHLFHVDSNQGESSIGYNMIVGSDPMVHLVLMEYFKHQVIHWDRAEFL